MSVTITLEDINWAYAHSTIPSLTEISLTVTPGEFVVLCGASGSGKSSLLRTINGLIPQAHPEGTLTGTVRINGQPTTQLDLATIGHHVGTVMQHPRRQFFAHTIPAELAFTLENHGVAPEKIRRRVNAALEHLRPHVNLSSPLAALSGGQQQQVAIAATTTHAPSALLLDEPSANLSAAAISRLAQKLTELKQSGVTIIIAEHRLSYLEHLADRIVIMHAGQIFRAWDAAVFRQLPDDHPAKAGLRGATPEPSLPALPATGASIAAAPQLPDAHPAPTRPGTTAHHTNTGWLPNTGCHPNTGLVLEHVRCERNGQRTLDITHATFPAGQVTAIRGENGAGKTTLARIIAGLQRSTGTVRLNGRTLRPRERQRLTGFVMQDVQRQLFSDTALAEVTEATHHPAAAEAGAQALRDLGLEPLATRHPLSLSGGEQQRLAIATVRAGAHPIVILDEPSSGVDRHHLGAISDQIRTLARRGAVVLLISHDDELLNLAADADLTMKRLRRSTPQ